MKVSHSYAKREVDRAAALFASAAFQKDRADRAYAVALRGYELSRTALGLATPDEEMKPYDETL